MHEYEDYCCLGPVFLPPPPVRGKPENVEVCEAGGSPAHGGLQSPGDHALHQRDPVRLGRLQPHRRRRLCLDLHQRHPGRLRLPEVRVRRSFVPLLKAE